jgi:hypothetical protein
MIQAPSLATADENGWSAFTRFTGLWEDASEDDIAERHDDHLYDRD